MTVSRLYIYLLVTGSWGKPQHAWWFLARWGGEAGPPKENLDLQTAALLVSETEAWDKVVLMGSWWYDRHLSTAQTRLCGHRELRQPVAVGGRALPWATVQHCQASEHVSPGWREREAWGARMGGEAKIASFMLSRSEKLHCFLKLFLSGQLPQAFGDPLTGWSPTRSVSQELIWIRIFFFQTEKKIPNAVMQKAGASAFPVVRSFTACAHAFLNRICCCVCFCLLIVCLCWTPIRISRQTIGDLYPENLQHLFQFRKEGHIVLTRR